MTVGIRADWCIALRMIALHEFYRRNREALDALFNDEKIVRLEEACRRNITIGEPNEHS